MNALKTWLCIPLLCALVACASGSDENDSGDGHVDSAPSGEHATPASADVDESTSKNFATPTVTPTTSVPSSAGAGGAGPSRSASSGSVPASDGSAPPAASGAVPSTPSAGSAEPGSSGATPPAKDESTTPPPSDTAPQSGTLTAGAWDDNLNFDRFTKYRAGLLEQQLHGALPSTDEEHKSAHEEFGGERPAHDKLDVALVIDTTGSMGDEIRYLQSEFLALSQSIEEQYPNAEQRWALIAYRDQGDAYVTRVFDFEQDAESFRTKLAALSAGGGGDFPEAPDAALAAMAQLSWRDDAAIAQLAFWVADAPHHDDRASALLDAIRAARSTGVHIYPVASSGIDELTELTMRSASQLTGGRYLFLTDDSGVGGAHKEPTIPCYYVTRLDNAILRMVDAEMTGKHVEPSTDQIIRTSGTPDNGTCKLSSGETVAVY